MEKIYYDVIYLTACGVNSVRPSEAFLMELKRRGEENRAADTQAGQQVSYLEQLYRVSRAHSLDALVGSTLRQAGIELPRNWTEGIAKAVRKALLFDAERKGILDFMEQRGIWYLPLKGVVLKDYYPAVGMRQMSDNDILYDADFGRELLEYMKSRGYRAVSMGIGTHDVYRKEPVLNFEMHRALYGTSHDPKWVTYYRNVKERLLPDNGSSYGYHFSREDFYVYLVCHAFKHYSVSGTGLRTLLDFYVYLRAEETQLDIAYIRRECEVLGIAAFEELSKTLSKKIFALPGDCSQEDFEKRLSLEEGEALSYYLCSGVHGTRINYTKKEVQKRGKVGFLLYKLFLPLPLMEDSFPILQKAPFLLPVCWVVRWIKPFFVRERRERAIGQLRAFLKVVRKDR